MHVWNVLHAARWKYRTQKWCKKSPFEHHRTTLSGYIFATKARIDNRKKLVKQQYLLQMSPQYGELGPLAAEIDWQVWGTPANFNGFRVLASLLQRRRSTEANQSARRLAVSWAGRLFIHFQRLLPRNGIFQVQNSLCVLQVLHSAILGALLHGTRAVGTSQVLRRWAHGATYIQQGDHHVEHWPTF